MAAGRLQAQNSTRRVSLATRATRATNPWARFLGLMGRRALPQGEGLHLSPCSSVHTWFMRIPIDVLYLDLNHRVVKIVPAMRPWRFSWGARGAHSVFELPAGTVAATNTAVGDQVEFT